MALCCVFINVPSGIRYYYNMLSVRMYRNKSALCNAFINMSFFLKLYRIVRSMLLECYVDDSLHWRRFKITKTVLLMWLFFCCLLLLLILLHFEGTTR